jgi:hypothetical protein
VPADKLNSESISRAKWATGLLQTRKLLSVGGARAETEVRVRGLVKGLDRGAYSICSGVGPR